MRTSSYFDSADIIEHSKNKYACHTLVKLLPFVGKEERRVVLNHAFKNIGKLLRHKYSARLIESLYATYANKQDRVNMLRECFAPDFQLLGDVTCSNLDELLTKYPDKRERVLDRVKAILDKAIK